MVDEIAPEEVHEKLEDGGDVQVVDIRRPNQYEQGHIPEAENIPFPELPRQIDEHDWGDEIVVACAIGQSSQQAARMLESYEGVDESASVLNLAGGYRDWEFDLDAE